MRSMLWMRSEITPPSKRQQAIMAVPAAIFAVSLSVIALSSDRSSAADEDSACLARAEMTALAHGTAQRRRRRHRRRVRRVRVDDLAFARSGIMRV